MTDDGYKIDPNLLEDGEHVLWAQEDIAPRKSWKYAYWIIVALGILANGYRVFVDVQSWQHFTEVWTDPEGWRFFGISAVAIFAVWMFLNWAIGKGWTLKQQSEHYVGMITNNRLVLHSAVQKENIILWRGDIETVQLDYSNGARALRLALSDNATIPQVVITTSGDILAAKKLIEDRFIINQAAGSVEVAK